MRLSRILILLMLTLCMACTAYANEQQQLISSFQAKVEQDLRPILDGYKATISYPVYYGVDSYNPKPAWRKTTLVGDGSYSFDIEKTSSLVSPYQGTVFFSYTAYFGKKQPDRTTAEQDNTSDDKPMVFKHKITYLFQGDSWALKRIQTTYNNYEWGDYTGSLQDLGVEDKLKRWKSYDPK